MVVPPIGTSEMYFCKKCNLSNAPVYDSKCMNCGSLKRSEIKKSKDYLIVFSQQSTMGEYLNVKSIGAYDMSKRKPHEDQ